MVNSILDYRRTRYHIDPEHSRKPQNIFNMPHSATKYQQEASENRSIFCPQMSIYLDRWQSLQHSSNNTCKKDLADAGFYAYPESDRLTCFHCGGGITNWDANDPWFEHAKWYPNCEYLIQKKGREYVESVSRRFPYLRGSKKHDPVQNSLESLTTNFSSTSLEDSAFSPSNNSSADILEHVSNPGHLTTNVKVQNGTSGGSVSSPFDKYSWLSGSSFEVTSLGSTCSAMETASSTASDSPNSLNLNRKPQSTSSSKSKLVKQFPRNSTKRSELKENVNCDETQRKFEQMQQQQICKVCLDRTSNCLFQPCGHLCCCLECASSLFKCPLCRKRLEKVIKVYRE